MLFRSAPNRASFADFLAPLRQVLTFVPAAAKSVRAAFHIGRRPVCPANRAKLHVGEPIPSDRCRRASASPVPVVAIAATAFEARTGVEHTAPVPVSLPASQRRTLCVRQREPAFSVCNPLVVDSLEPLRPTESAESCHQR